VVGAPSSSATSEPATDPLHAYLFATLADFALHIMSRSERWLPHSLLPAYHEMIVRVGHNISTPPDDGAMDTRRVFCVTSSCSVHKSRHHSKFALPVSHSLASTCTPHTQDVAKLTVIPCVDRAAPSSHYTNELALGEGNSLDARVVKDTFSFDYGFKGNYKVHLEAGARRNDAHGGGGDGGGGGGGCGDGGGDGRIDGASDGNGDGKAPLLREAEGLIKGLAAGAEYWCVVEEDPEIERGRTTYTAPSKTRGAGSHAADDLTKQLMSLSTDELKEQSVRYGCASSACPSTEGWV
jgi:hypothetical protein